MKLKKTKKFQFKSSWLFGLVLSVMFTLTAVVIFALIVAMGNVPDRVIRIVNQLIKLGAVVFGVHFSVHRGDEKGVTKGALTGFAYMAAGVLLYALFTRQELPFTSYLMDIFLGIAAGGLYGLIKKQKIPPKCDKSVA